MQQSARACVCVYNALIQNHFIALRIYSALFGLAFVRLCVDNLPPFLIELRTESISRVHRCAQAEVYFSVFRRKVWPCVPSKITHRQCLSPIKLTTRQFGRVRTSPARLLCCAVLNFLSAKIHIVCSGINPFSSHYLFSGSAVLGRRMRARVKCIAVASSNFTVNPQLN